MNLGELLFTSYDVKHNQPIHEINVRKKPEGAIKNEQSRNASCALNLISTFLLLHSEEAWFVYYSYYIRFLAVNVVHL